jgi:hypothetical protein
MLFRASHIATALTATGAGFNRPSNWRFVATCAYVSSSNPIVRAGQGSMRKPE